MDTIELYTYCQEFEETIPLDIEEITKTEIREKIKWETFKVPSRIGIVVGSRGINSICLIVKAAVDTVKEKGHFPVIIPAMGSHGGGTSEGQLAVLNSLGINEEFLRCPIESSIETEIITHIDEIPVHIDKIALACQGLILINRIKAHTSFTGEIESGLLKMAVIGLGNPNGAALIHSFGPKGLKELIPKIGKYIVANIPIKLGIAVIEDSNKEICLLKGIKPEEIYIEEQKLLLEAKNKMAKLPINNLDILIIEEMGKCFSGTGIDTNIIGRLRVKDIAEPKEPDIQRIIVLDLAEASNGNATGVGLADFVTKNLVNKINWGITYKNVITTTFTQRAMLPIVMDNEKEALKAAIKSLGKTNIEKIRVIKVKNTLDLNEIKVSKNLLWELNKSKGLISENPQEILCL